MKEILVIIAEFLITFLMCVGAGYFLVKKKKNKRGLARYIFMHCYTGYPYFYVFIF